MISSDPDKMLKIQTNWLCTIFATENPYFWTELFFIVNLFSNFLQPIFGQTKRSILQSNYFVYI